MMRPRLIRLAAMCVGLTMLAVYFWLNASKLDVFRQDWAQIDNGPPALEVRLTLSGEAVFRQRLQTSEIFDAAGNRQIYFVHLPKQLFARVRGNLVSASLEIDQQEAAVSETQNTSALLAVTAGQRIYLLEEGELKYMMTVIWNERLHAGSIVQCTTASLCKSVQIDSRDWGPVQGPFLDTDILPERRGLPKGRWAKGPDTILRIRADSRRKVTMQINLLGVEAGQVLRFRGAASHVQKLDRDLAPVQAGGRELYPAIYLLELDLQPGDNFLDMSFSAWLQSGGQGAYPLAAYLFAIGLKDGA